MKVNRFNIPVIKYFNDIVTNNCILENPLFKNRFINNNEFGIELYKLYKK